MDIPDISQVHNMQIQDVYLYDDIIDRIDIEVDNLAMV